MAVYMKFGDIKGDVETTGFEKRIELSWCSGALAEASARRRGRRKIARPARRA